MKKSCTCLFLLVISSHLFAQLPRLLVARPPAAKFLSGVTSPDGRLVATMSEDRMVIIWDAVTGQELFESGYNPTDLEQNDLPGINQVKFSPDSRYLLAWNNSVLGAAAFLFDLTGTGSVRPVETHIVRAAFSKDSKKLTVINSGGVVSVFLTKSGAYFNKIENDQEVDYDNILNDAFKSFKEMSGGKMPTDSAAKAKLLRRFHEEMEAKEKKLEDDYNAHPRHRADSAYLSKEIQLALSDPVPARKFAYYSRLATDPPVRVSYHPGDFLADGNLLLSNEQGESRELELRTGRIIPLACETPTETPAEQSAPEQAVPDCFTCSPRGTYQWDNSGLLKLRTPGMSTAPEGEVENRIIEIKTGRVVASFPLSYLDGVVFSADEQLAAISRHAQKKVTILRLSDGKIIQKLDGYIQPSVAYPFPIFTGMPGTSYFSPDNQLLVLLTDIKRPLQPKNDTMVNVPARPKMPLNMTEIYNMANSSPGEGNRLVIMNITTGKLQAVLDGMGPVAVPPPEFERNGHFLKVSDLAFGRKVRYDTRTGAKVSDDASTEKKELAISPDERFTAKDAGDGKIEIARASDGKTILTCIPVSETASIRITAEGYYDLPKENVTAIYFVGDGMRLVTFDQLDTRYNRPDKVLAAVDPEDKQRIAAYLAAYLDRLARLSLDTADFTKTPAVPELQIVNRFELEKEDAAGRTGRQVRLILKAAAPGGSLSKWQIRLNRDPLFGVAGLPIKKLASLQWDTTVSLSPGKNTIEVSVLNTAGIENYRQPLVLNLHQPAVAGKLYFVGIGVNGHSGEPADLKWCEKDIRELSRTLAGRFGDRLVIDTLLGRKVNKAAVLAMKARLKSLGENDRVVIAYSGDGLPDSNGALYLAGYDTDADRPAAKGIPYQAVEDLLDGIPPRHKLLLLDACNSGDYDKAYQGTSGLPAKHPGLVPYDRRNTAEVMRDLFANVAVNNGSTIIASTGSSKASGESDNLQHGFFTLAVLEALRQNRQIRVSELKAFLLQRVPELSAQNQQPIVRAENIDDDWSL